MVWRTNMRQIAAAARQRLKLGEFGTIQTDFIGN
jgi:hypothetical protein